MAQKLRESIETLRQQSTLNAPAIADILLGILKHVDTVESESAVAKKVDRVIPLVDDMIKEERLKTSNACSSIDARLAALERRVSDSRLDTSLTGDGGDARVSRQVNVTVSTIQADLQRTKEEVAKLSRSAAQGVSNACLAHHTETERRVAELARRIEAFDTTFASIVPRAAESDVSARDAVASMRENIAMVTSGLNLLTRRMDDIVSISDEHNGTVDRRIRDIESSAAAAAAAAAAAKLSALTGRVDALESSIPTLTSNAERSAAARVSDALGPVLRQLAVLNSKHDETAGATGRLEERVAVALRRTSDAEVVTQMAEALSSRVDAMDGRLSDALSLANAATSELRDTREFRRTDMLSPALSGPSAIPAVTQADLAALKNRIEEVALMIDDSAGGTARAIRVMQDALLRHEKGFASRTTALEERLNCREMASRELEASVVEAMHTLGDAKAAVAALEGIASDLEAQVSRDVNGLSTRIDHMTTDIDAIQRRFFDYVESGILDRQFSDMAEDAAKIRAAITALEADTARNIYGVRQEVSSVQAAAEDARSAAMATRLSNEDIMGRVETRAGDVVKAAISRIMARMDALEAMNPDVMNQMNSFKGAIQETLSHVEHTNNQERDRVDRRLAEMMAELRELATDLSVRVTTEMRTERSSLKEVVGRLQDELVALSVNVPQQMPLGSMLDPGASIISTGVQSPRKNMSLVGSGVGGMGTASNLANVRDDNMRTIGEMAREVSSLREELNGLKDSSDAFKKWIDDRHAEKRRIRTLEANAEATKQQLLSMQDEIITTVLGDLSRSGGISGSVPSVSAREINTLRKELNADSTRLAGELSEVRDHIVNLEDNLMTRLNNATAELTRRVQDTEASSKSQTRQFYVSLSEEVTRISSRIQAVNAAQSEMEQRLETEMRNLQVKIPLKESSIEEAAVKSLASRLSSLELGIAERFRNTPTMQNAVTYTADPNVIDRSVDEEMSSRFASAADLRDLEECLSTLSLRFSAVEKAVESRVLSSPGSSAVADLSDVYKRLNDLSSSVSDVRTGLLGVTGAQAVNESLDRRLRSVEVAVHSVETQERSQRGNLERFNAEASARTEQLESRFGLLDSRLQNLQLHVNDSLNRIDVRLEGQHAVGTERFSERLDSLARTLSSEIKQVSTNLTALLDTAAVSPLAAVSARLDNLARTSSEEIRSLHDRILASSTARESSSTGSYINVQSDLERLRRTVNALEERTSVIDQVIASVDGRIRDVSHSVAKTVAAESNEKFSVKLTDLQVAVDKAMASSLRAAELAREGSSGPLNDLRSEMASVRAELQRTVSSIPEIARQTAVPIAEDAKMEVARSIRPLNASIAELRDADEGIKKELDNRISQMHSVISEHVAALNSRIGTSAKK